MHLAESLENGERENMIIWMRSSTIRNEQCPLCQERPHLVPFEGFGDGFT